MKKRNPFIYNKFLSSIDHLKKIKIYFIISITLFALISLIGFIFPIFFEEQIIKIIEEIINQTQGLSPLELTRFIMLNNIKSAFFAMIFGIYLGLLPIAVIVLNAYVLGFISNKTVASEGIFILWRLFPHGIFEIPAVLLSTAMGLNLGFFLLTYQGKNKLEEFLNQIKKSLITFTLVIIPLLVIAGIIEGILITLVK